MLILLLIIVVFVEGIFRDDEFERILPIVLCLVSVTAQIFEQLLRVQAHAVVIVDRAIEQIWQLRIAHRLTVIGAIEFRERIERISREET
jgi:hypothetical protein